MLVFEHPVAHLPQCRHQVDPRLRQLIFDARRDFREGIADHDAVVREIAQLLGQHMLRHSRKSPAQFAKPEWPLDEDAHDLDLPLAGDGANGSLEAQDIDRLGARAPGALVFIVDARLYSLVFHTGSENSSYLIF